VVAEFWGGAGTGRSGLGACLAHHGIACIRLKIPRMCAPSQLVSANGSAIFLL